MAVTQNCHCPSDANHKSKLSAVLLTMGHRGDLPMTPSLGLINLLQQIAELRETLVYSYQFITKDIIKDTDEEACRMSLDRS